MSIRAKKSLGQHFLRSVHSLAKIIEVADVTQGDLVLEIGPGEGVLTKKLVACGAQVIGVEKDERCIDVLHELFSEKATPPAIIHGDILDPELEQMLFHKEYIGNRPYKVVANIPYYITGALFRLFLEKLRQPTSLTFLVQKEVADQIIARDGKESILSLAVKIYGDPEYGGKVKREAFSPPPKVDSAIIHVARISRMRLEGLSDDDFFRVLKAGFRARRKKLLGNFRDGLMLPKDLLEGVFDELHINKDIRGEDLTLPNWIALAKKLSTPNNK